MSAYGPYTPVRQAGDLYFVSGQIGVREDKTADTGISGQTKQAIQNLNDRLKESGLELGDVVKATVYLVDMDDYAPMNEAYEQMIPAPRPARAAIAVKELPRIASNTPLLIEIEAVAYKEKK